MRFNELSTQAIANSIVGEPSHPTGEYGPCVGSVLFLIRLTTTLCLTFGSATIGRYVITAASLEPCGVVLARAHLARLGRKFLH
jgi:hypothetical protein